MSTAKIIGLIVIGALLAACLLYSPAAAPGWMVALVLLANTPNRPVKP